MKKKIHNALQNTHYGTAFEDLNVDLLIIKFNSFVTEAVII